MSLHKLASNEVIRLGDLVGDAAHLDDDDNLVVYDPNIPHELNNFSIIEAEGWTRYFIGKTPAYYQEDYVFWRHGQREHIPHPIFSKELPLP
jgi:sorbitol-specific phosphotransferase system component IIA